MGNNKKSKKEQHHNNDSVDRRVVACAMTSLFTLASESRKNNPERWTKERRTKYNDRVRMIQWLFSTAQYVSAKQWLDWLDSDFHITGKKHEKTDKQEKQK